MGASKVTSSAELNAPQKVPPMWQPTPESLRLARRVSRYTQNSEGDNIAPCLTPFFTGKVELLTEFHLI